MSVRQSSRTKLILAISVAAWAIGVGLGWRQLSIYANTPGKRAEAPANWPAGSPIRQTSGRPSIVVFVHPQCPCSLATITELARIVATAPRQFDIDIFFYRPGTERAEWSRTDLWRNAAAVPGARLADDRDAEMARVFGARVSGQAMVYDAGGALLFNGGITSARGHAGDSDGRDAILAIARNETPERRTTPVFGCALYATE